MCFIIAYYDNILLFPWDESQCVNPYCLHNQYYRLVSVRLAPMIGMLVSQCVIVPVSSIQMAQLKLRDYKSTSCKLVVSMSAWNSTLTLRNGLDTSWHTDTCYINLYCLCRFSMKSY